MTTVELARDLLAFCEQHPTLRFWQAVSDWSGHPFIRTTAAMEGPLREMFYVGNEDVEEVIRRRLAHEATMTD